MDEGRRTRAPLRPRFAVLTQDRPATVTYSQDKVWNVDLHDGAELLSISEDMLRAGTDLRHRLAIDEILEHERGKPDPHPLIRDLDHA